MKNLTHQGLAFLMILFCLLSCDKDNDKSSITTCSLYGTVTDKATGLQLSNVGIELLPIGQKSITGSDGQFEFTEVPEGKYFLYATKTGYTDYKSNEIIVNSKNNRPVSIQIEKLPPTLSILDENGDELSELDFGSNPEVVMRSFLIFNKGEETLEWSIAYTCNWIASLSSTSGELKPNASKPLVVKIDRNRLNIGNNSTTLHIVSNNGTKQITISASINNIIETLEASDVRANSAVLNGQITRDMAPSITEHGFVYGKNAAPTIANGAYKISKSGAPSIGVSYNMFISSLDKETKYYARAFVTNNLDTIYGEQISFLTIEGLPAVKTLGSRNTTSSSAIIQCEAVDDAGAAISARGVCYGLSPLPAIDGQHTTDGSGIGKWESSLSGLSPNATYYIRAYATNSYGTGYGEQITISTTEGLASVKTGTASSVTTTSATCNGEVLSDGDRQVTERGICWGISPYPTTANTHTTNGSGTGKFSCALTQLTAGTTYHFRAYAINSAGTSYGEDVTFTTLSTTPSVTTLSAKNITSTSATICGAIASTGGANITQVGFVYQSENDYYNHTIQATLSGNSFSYDLDNLQPDTKYYFYAYAINQSGTSNGEVFSFTTISGLPQVTTSSSSSIGSVSAIVTGKILSDGGFPITECGICYSSTNRQPTITDKIIKNTTAQIGQFNCELTNLSPSTKYYARAYAKNANGIAYGTSINFKTTDGMPAVRILQQPTYNGNNATLYGEITSNGGVDIEYYGVAYSRTNTMPSIENKEAIQYLEGNPLSSTITFNVTNIPSGAMIYYRFFVVNSLGKTAYSSAGYIMGNF